MKNVTATQFVRDDYKRLFGLFRQYEAAEKGRNPERIVGVSTEAFLEISIHCRLISEIFYPAVRNLLGSSADAVIQQNLEAHRSALRDVQAIRKFNSEDPRFSERMNDLIDNLTLHFEEEDAELLTQVDGVDAQILLEIGARLVARRSEIMALPQYRMSRPEMVQNPKGGEQKRKTAA